MAHRASERVADTAQLLTEGRGQEQELAGRPWQALGQQMIDTADKNMDLAPLQAEFWLYAVRHPEAMEAFAARVRKRREPLERLLTSEFDRDGGDYPDDLACPRRDRDLGAVPGHGQAAPDRPRQRAAGAIRRRAALAIHRHQGQPKAGSDD